MENDVAQARKNNMPHGNIWDRHVSHSVPVCECVCVRARV